MKTPEGLKWAVLVIMAFFFAYLGKISFQHRFVGLFPLVVIGAAAIILFIFHFLSERASE